MTQSEPVVLEVNIATSQAGLLGAYAQRAVLYRAYVNEEARARKKMMAQPDPPELAKLQHHCMLKLSPSFGRAEHQLLNCDELIVEEQKKDRESLGASTAFVTFEEWEHCQNVLAAYKVRESRQCRSPPAVVLAVDFTGGALSTVAGLLRRLAVHPHCFPLGADISLACEPRPRAV
jgi:hypothetical protein